MPGGSKSRLTFSEWEESIYLAVKQRDIKTFNNLLELWPPLYIEIEKNAKKYDFLGGNYYYDLGPIEECMDDLVAVMHNALIIAAAHSDMEMVQNLLDKFYHPDQTFPNCFTDYLYNPLSLYFDDKGGHALIVALKNGNIALAKLLIENLARVDCYNDDGETPLTVAAENNQLEIVEMICDNIKKNVIRFENIYPELEKSDRQLHTPLMLAAANGHLDVVKLLLEQGALVNSKNPNNKRTAISYAARNGHLDVVKYLCNKGAFLNELDDDLYTPLLLAAAKNHSEIVEFLLSQGVEILAKDKKGKSLIHLAAKKDKINIIKLLDELHIDLELKDQNGETPLSLAATNNNIETMRFLLGKKVNIESKKNQNNTPLLQAAMMGSYEAVELLLEQGANINAKNLAHETALHLAANNGRQEVVKLLLENGADLKAKDTLGGTPYRCAVLNHHENTSAILSKKTLQNFLATGSEANSKHYFTLFSHARKERKGAQALLENVNGHDVSVKSYKNTFKNNPEIQEICDQYIKFQKR